MARKGLQCRRGYGRQARPRTRESNAGGMVCLQRALQEINIVIVNLRSSLPVLRGTVCFWPIDLASFVKQRIRRSHGLARNPDSISVSIPAVLLRRACHRYVTMAAQLHSYTLPQLPLLNDLHSDRRIRPVLRDRLPSMGLGQADRQEIQYGDAECQHHDLRTQICDSEEGEGDDEAMLLLCAVSSILATDLTPKPRLLETIFGSWVFVHVVQGFDGHHLTWAVSVAVRGTRGMDYHWHFYIDPLKPKFFYLFRGCGLQQCSIGPFGQAPGTPGIGYDTAGLMIAQTCKAGQAFTQPDGPPTCCATSLCAAEPRQLTENVKKTLVQVRPWLRPSTSGVIARRQHGSSQAMAYVPLPPAAPDEIFNRYRGICRSRKSAMVVHNAVLRQTTSRGGQSHPKSDRDPRDCAEDWIEQLVKSSTPRSDVVRLLAPEAAY
ncbi:hypothetical protein KCU88_g383, partial [Aureobasidium melanogenum]